MLMQISESGVIQIESIVIAAVVFVLLACSVVFCTSITAFKLLRSVAPAKTVRDVKPKKENQFKGLFTKVAAIAAPAAEAPGLDELDSDELAEEVPDINEMYTDEPAEDEPDTEDVDINEQGDDEPDTDDGDYIDTTAFDELFACEDDGFEYYEDAAV